MPLSGLSGSAHSSHEPWAAVPRCLWPGRWRMMTVRRLAAAPGLAYRSCDDDMPFSLTAHRGCPPGQAGQVEKALLYPGGVLREIIIVDPMMREHQPPAGA